MKVVDVQIEEGWINRRLTLLESGACKHLPLPGGRLNFISRPVDLWSKDAFDAFEKAFADTGIAAELDIRIFKNAGPLMLRVPAGEASHLPWEAFQRFLYKENRKRLAVQRRADPEPGFRFGSFEHPMRALILIGHPGAGQEFDPERAEGFLNEAFAAAKPVSEGRIDGSLAMQLRRDSLRDIAMKAAKFAPNIVFYFGHGKHDGQPNLLLGEDASSWISVSELVTSLFPDGRAYPPYWVFWACSLAEDTAQPGLCLEGPDVLRALGDPGAVAILAMRARIAVKTAQTMLEALVGALAAGEPLEIAAAWARAAAISLEPDGPGRMDYAAPAVWSRSEPVDRITWGEISPFPASWVALPLFADVAGANSEAPYPEFQTGVAVVDEATEALAAVWDGQARLFVELKGTYSVVDDPGLKARVFGAAAKIRRTTGRPVVPIWLGRGGRFSQRLKLWATNAHRSLDPRHHDRELALALAEMTEEPLRGLARLLSVPNIIIILSEPPDLPRAWRDLSEGPDGSSIVVLGNTVPDRSTDWTLDALMPDLPEKSLANLAATDPLGCAVLSVIERPLAQRDVETLAGSASDAFFALEDFLVSVGSRRILSASARSMLKAEITGKNLEKARRLCVDFLSTLSGKRDFGTLLEICRQQIALNEEEAAAEVVNQAWAERVTQWSLQEKVQVLGLAARTPMLADNLKEDLLFDIIAAAITVQDMPVARLMLESIRTSSDENRIRKHDMLAECYKADSGRPGAVAAMRRNAKAAVALTAKLAERGTIPEGEHFRRRLNLARIEQYFDHEYEKALDLYDQTLEALDPHVHENANLAEICAAACRNAAECILDPAQRPLGADTLDRVEAYLERGRRLAESNDLTIVKADLLYTRARTLEASGDDVAAAQYLSGLANGEQARIYPLMAAIAADRLGWNEVRRGEPIVVENLRARLRRLDRFDHAWAARVSLKSRLRGAQTLVGLGGSIHKQQASRLLDENRELYDSLTQLSGREDAQVAARTFAGLEVLSEEPENIWTAFKEYNAFNQLPEDWRRYSANEIWEMGV
ncbi:hypothetical protein [Roseibium album]|uniref:hypothetical protein n=1 Tax=Roseibium album TaxID=311410 RepID=UPI003BAE93BD